MCNDFLNSPLYATALNVLILNCLDPKRRQREKWKREKNKQTNKQTKNRQWILKSLEVTSARGKVCNSFCLFCVWPPQSAISNQKTNPQYLEDRILSAHPDSRKLPTNCSRNIWILPAMWLWAIGEIPATALLPQDLKLTKMKRV